MQPQTLPHLHLNAMRETFSKFPYPHQHFIPSSALATLQPAAECLYSQSTQTQHPHNVMLEDSHVEIPRKILLMHQFNAISMCVSVYLLYHNLQKCKAWTSLFSE